MLGRIRSLINMTLCDLDVRGYLSHVVLRPHLWKADRPDFRASTPDYLCDSVSPNAAASQLRARLPISWGDRATGGIGEIRLAATPLRDVRFDAMPWTRSFDDLEDEASLHRFAWLLPWLVAECADGASATAVWQSASAAIYDWIRNHPAPSELEAWQAYTTSERIVNWSIAAIAAERTPLEDPIAQSVASQASHLLQHLEYYGEQTGNHLSNNGRALYIAGAMLGRSDLMSAGRAIALRERERIIEHRGFVREDSSHYQFLITRNYAELLWFARISGDSEFEAALKPIVRDLAAACEFFLVRHDSGLRIPLIGDISPDCTPEWLLSVPATAVALAEGIATTEQSSACDWSALFGRGAEIDPQPDGITIEREWVRFERSGWTLFAHVNRSGTPHVPGHAHHDTGGIIAFLDGEPVILDCGRATYKDNALGRFGVGAESHSLVMVDGLNPEPRDHWLFSREYLRMRSGGAPVIRALANGFEIEHSGYARSKGVGICRRRVEVVDGELRMEDSVEGSGIHHVMLTFHVPNGARRFELVAPGDTQSSEGRAAVGYGKEVAITTMTANMKVRLPWSGSSRLRRRDA